MLPGGWDLAHAIRLGIKPFTELRTNSEAWGQVDSLFLPNDLRIGPGSDATVSKDTKKEGKARRMIDRSRRGLKGARA